MMLIGGGGNGNASTTGGGSGAIAVWYGAAQHVPDDLVLTVSTGNASDTIIQYHSTNGLNALITAGAGIGSTAGSATTAGPFGASGFINVINGQAGSTASITADANTFLTGGGDLGSDTVTANYGYDSTATNAKGYFQLQPIIVGVGASGSGNGGIGCGGGRTGLGGQGLILIASM
jgi:hypothetical protein